MIKVKKTSLPGVLEIERKPLLEDHRGIYGEIFKEREYAEAGIDVKFVEQDFSLSEQNVLRGLHGDAKTWKLCCCLFGKLYLAVLNHNQQSPFLANGKVSFLLLKIVCRYLYPRCMPMGT